MGEDGGSTMMISPKNFQQCWIVANVFTLRGHDIVAMESDNDLANIP
jgi:hypothetical protein